MKLKRGMLITGAITIFIPTLFAVAVRSEMAFSWSAAALVLMWIALSIEDEKPSS